MSTLHSNLCWMPSWLLASWIAFSHLLPLCRTISVSSSLTSSRRLLDTNATNSWNYCYSNAQHVCSPFRADLADPCAVSCSLVVYGTKAPSMPYPHVPCEHADYQLICRAVLSAGDAQQTAGDIHAGWLARGGCLACCS